MDSQLWCRVAYYPHTLMAMQTSVNTSRVLSCLYLTHPIAPYIYSNICALLYTVTRMHSFSIQFSSNSQICLLVSECSTESRVLSARHLIAGAQQPFPYVLPPCCLQATSPPKDYSPNTRAWAKSVQSLPLLAIVSADESPWIELA